MKPIKTTIIFIGICLVLTAGIIWYLIHTTVNDYERNGKAENEIRVLIKNGNSLYHEEVDRELLAEGMYQNKHYPGYFEILETENGYAVINVVPVETYLQYVLPSEMPASFEVEALKAQAVCARTFAYMHMQNPKYSELGAHVDDTTDSQVYNQSDLSDRTAMAVKKTAGEVLWYEEELISCYYYSTSPGMTGDLEVWAASSPDYIKVKENDYDKESPYYTWEATLDFEGEYDEERGVLLDVEIRDYSEAGFVTELALCYEKEEVVLEKELEIRNFLGKFCKELKLADGTLKETSVLPSAYFSISNEAGLWVLHGGGFGHGIGMSQYGANGMAKEGCSYKEILEFYFENTQLLNMHK